MDQAKGHSLAKLTDRHREHTSDSNHHGRFETTLRHDAPVFHQSISEITNLIANRTTLYRDHGSFRDPSGFVFHHNGKVYRAIDDSFARIFDELDRSGLLGQLQDESQLIRTRRVNQNEFVNAKLPTEFSQTQHSTSVLHHERIPFLSYPYEWSSAMLADAAMCTLDLQLQVMAAGYSLKDATAYNVQFMASQPVFIDITSIEAVERKDVWTALDQFYRMFLYPLLLSAYGRTHAKSYFLSHIDGMEPDDVCRRVGRFAALRPAMLLDVWLPCQLKRLANRRNATLRKSSSNIKSDSAPLELNLKRLRNKISKIVKKSRNEGTWLNYENDNNYDGSAEAAKRSFVQKHVGQMKPKRVLDIGCNTGTYSRIAADQGASVVALDSDTSCIDALYRDANDNGRDILPLVMNIANPSPGIGFRNVERPSFLDRASFDCVFALALIHHLYVTSNLPIVAIRDLLVDLTEDTLVVEFIEPSDSMFQRLRGSRTDTFAEFSIEQCKYSFAQRLDILDESAVTPHRTLVAYRKRR